MLQHMFPFARPTSWSPRAWRQGSLLGVSCLALLGAGWLGPLASAQAQTTVNYNFEDGVVRGTPTQMQVPPKILTENGNKFMRITGSAGDKQAIPDKYPNRNRSQVKFTSHYPNMPLITSANMRQTYSFDMRFKDDAGNDGMVFELFQDGTIPETYGARNGTGPVVSMWRKDGRVWGRAWYANSTKFTNFDLGPVRSGQWHTYKVVAVWSHTPSQGRIEFFFDGVRKLLVTGRDSNLGPDSNRLPMLTLGLYGDYAVGAIDVDNVKAGPSSSSSPAPSVALSAPTNLRLASGE
jgi:hypothetical protein